MIERAYTVREIEALRHALWCKRVYGRYDWNRASGWSKPYNEHDVQREVEMRLRTHMQAGHTAEELIASEESER